MRRTGPLVFFEGFSINGFARISGKWLPNPTTFGRLFLRFYQRDGFSLKLSSGEPVAVVPKAYAIDVNLESGMEAWVNDLLHDGFLIEAADDGSPKTCPSSASKAATCSLRATARRSC